MPAKARDKNINVPISSPRKAAASVLRVCCRDPTSRRVTGEGSWNGSSGSVPLIWLPLSDILELLLLAREEVDGTELEE